MKPKVPSRVLEIEPYEPGRPVEDVERELGIAGSIKLASNENPLGPSPAALSVLREAAAKAPSDIHRYPDGNGTVLRNALAAFAGVETEQVVIGNGSNEVIELLLRTFVSEGDEVLMSEEAFLIYRLASLASGARPVTAPSSNYRHDLRAIADRIGPATRMVFLANPNNPTGTIYTTPEWESFLSRVPGDVLVAVDEAYFEYADAADYPRALGYLGSHPGLVVMRTFSKAYGLAGLRVGYGVGSAELVGAMQRVRQPFNVGSLAQAAAVAALGDNEHIAASQRVAGQARRAYEDAFAGLGLDFVPSPANFVLVEVGDGKAVSSEMMRRGVIIRSMEAYGMPSKVRISFGTELENDRCIEALGAVLGQRAGKVRAGQTGPRHAAS